MGFIDKKSFWPSLVRMTLRIWVAGVSVGAMFFIAGGVVFAAAMFGLAVLFAGLSSNTEHLAGDTASPNKLLSIKIDGVIIGDSDDAGGLFSGYGTTAGYQVKDALYKAASDDSIQGILLDIDSPGGTIFGAHAIADGVEYYRKTTKKPVVAYAQGMAASGAYWAAASADKIIADYGSDVGSIGVISGPFTYYDGVLSDGNVVTQNGIQNTYITAGTSKDVGNPYRKLTPSEVAALQRSVNDDYDMFVRYVSQRRTIPENQIRGTIGALGYGNKAAKELKLIDDSGSRQVAYGALAKAAGVQGQDYEIIRPASNLFDQGAGSVIATALGRTQERQASAAQPCAISRVNLALQGDVTSFCRQR